MRGDSRGENAGGAAAGGAGALFARWGGLRGVQYVRWRRHVVRNAARESADAELQDDSLSRASRFDCIFNERAAAERSAGAAERYSRAFGADDAAGCGADFLHGFGNEGWAPSADHRCAEDL